MGRLRKQQHEVRGRRRLKKEGESGAAKWKESEILGLNTFTGSLYIFIEIFLKGEQEGAGRLGCLLLSKNHSKQRGGELHSEVGENKQFFSCLSSVIRCG